MDTDFWTSSKIPENTQLVGIKNLVGDDDNYNSMFSPPVVFNYNNPSGLSVNQQNAENDIEKILNSRLETPSEFIASQLKSINDETNINLSSPSFEDDEILKTISANRELKNNNFAAAEMILGRNIDDDELARQSITSERQYLKPPSRLEKLLSNIFVIKKENKDDLSGLIRDLNDLNISYKINDKGEEVEVVTGEKKTAPIFPKPIISTEREVETMEVKTRDQYLRSIGLDPTQTIAKSVDNLTGSYEDLEKYAKNLGVVVDKPKGSFGNNKEYLAYIRREVKNHIKDEITRLKNPQVSTEEIKGEGLKKRAFKQPQRRRNTLIPFGKYFLDANSLQKKGMIQLKTSKGNPTYKIGRVMASEKFNTLMKDLIESDGEINISKFKSLSKAEQDLFEKVLNVADIEYSFSNKKRELNDLKKDSELKREFLESFGSFKNGNNSPVLVEKINDLLDLLLGRGLISRSESLKVQHSIFGNKI